LSEIRVTYTGLISLISGIVSIVSSSVFLILLTRTLTVEQYGTWGLIGGLIIYPIALEPIVSYWSLREIARGNNSGKTAIFSSGLLSIIGIIVYITIVYLFQQANDVDPTALIFAVIMIPSIFLFNTMISITTGWKPHASSYGLIFYGMSLIPTILIFLYVFDLGIPGVIFSSAISYLIGTIFLVIYSRHKIINNIDPKFLKKWIKLSWLPLYNNGLSSVLFRSDVLIFVLITDSIVSLAYWTVAMSIPMFISQSGLISKAVYPKLIGCDKQNYLSENLRQVFYFSIPLTAFTIIFARPILFLLNPVYEEAFPIVIVISIMIFFKTFSGIFQQFLLGIENVDHEENPTFRDYIKSKIFRIPTLRITQFGIYILLLAIGLIILKTNFSDIELLTYWAFIAIFTQIPFTFYFYKLVRKNFNIKINILSILKYFTVSVLISIMSYLLMDNFLIYSNNIYEFLPKILFFTFIAIGSYFLITYLIDPNTKKLIKAIINEIKL
jgi:hypothetical protein